MKSLPFPRVLVLFVLLWGCDIAATPGVPTPTALPDGRIVTLQQARELVDGGAKVFDVRSALNYGRGHLPGAVMAPYKGNSPNRADFDPTLDRFALSLLPGDKDAAVLFYSHGDTGWKSYKAAITAIRAGYTRVNWLRDGYSVWVATGLPVER